MMSTHTSLQDCPALAQRDGSSPDQPPDYMKQMRLQRGYAKSKLTKCMRSIQGQMKDLRNVDSVLEKQNKLDLIETAFREVHNRYHQSIPESCTVLLEESCAYFDTAMKELYDLKEQLELWRLVATRLKEAARDIAHYSYTQLEQSNIENKVQADNHSVIASSTGSSRITAARASASAKKAALVAEAAAQKQVQHLEQEELTLKQKKKDAELAVEIAKAEAEERVYNEIEGSAGNSVHALSVHAAPVDKQDFIRSWQNSDIVNDISPVVKNIQHDDIMEYMLENQKQQQQLLDTIQLPKSELMQFDGDPINYWTFIRSFENTVERGLVDNTAKLTRLLQYCTGKALKAVQCCAVMDPDKGFTRAKEILKERFGNDFTICESWVKKVCVGQRFKPSDREGLLEFADELRSCEETLKAMNKSSEIMNQQSLVSIVDRLPVYLLNRWRREAHKLTKRNGKTTFNDIVVFVREAAEEANDPIYGNITELHRDKVSTKKSTHGTVTHKKDAYSFSAQNCTVSNTPNVTNSSTGNKPQQYRSCLKCGQGHSLFGCDQFKSMSSADRYKFAQEKRLCNNCLVPGHFAVNCLRDTKCTIPGCGRKHTKFLHPQTRQADTTTGTSSQMRENWNREINSSNQQGKVQHAPVVTSCKVTGAGAHEVTKMALPIVPVIVKSSSSSQFVETYALLDTGSTNTFCSEDLLKLLDIKSGNKEILSLTTLEKENSSVETASVKLQIADVNGENMIDLQKVYVRPSLPIDTENTAQPEQVNQYQHLRDIELPVVNSQTKYVTLLIGQDVPEALVPVEVRKGQRDEPYATRTALGWTVNGPIGLMKHHKAIVNFVHTSLEDQVENLWKIEASELLADQSTVMSMNDKRVINIWNDSICTSEGHYEMKIPFKECPPNLPNNKVVAERRLQLLGRRLQKNSELHAKYSDGMNDLLDKGYAVRVNANEVECDNGSVWYLPHHPVFNDNKPDKCRIVFDCASKCQGTSLNEQVYKGPDLMNNLVGVLLRFREHSIAAMADIEAMFHQVKVCSSDCNALRFLWWPDGDMSQQPVDYKMVVHLFGGIWSPSCAIYALQRTAEDNKEYFETETINTVLKNFYMDDCLKSFETEAQGIKLARELNELLQRGGFKLTKWISNSRSVLQSIPESKRAKTVKDLDFIESQLPVERALGVKWNIEKDEFEMKTSVASKPPTKRGILSIISSVYDPLGFVSPFILKAKKIFQELCRRKLDWDNKLPPDLLEQWKIWLSDLPKLEEFSIPRCIQSFRSTDLACSQLHHFADASQSGYGVVSYLRQVDSAGNVSCRFVASKSRLTPLKTITVPRLELSAATLAVKIDKMILQELEIPVSSSIFWTDSMLVIQYINNQDKRFNTFVANRIAAIHNGSEPAQWHYVNGILNPADDVSRGLSADEIVQKKQWISGPDFLEHDICEWPKMPGNVDEELFPPEEVKKKSKIYNIVTCQSDAVAHLLESHSSWYKLKKSVAWFLRLKKLLLSRVRHHNHGEKLSQPIHSETLTVEEIQVAGIEVLKYVQKQCFSEVRTLKALDPIKLSNGVLCVGGRLKNASVAEEAKHPIILPKHHHVVNLIIKHYHDISGHSGREHVLALIREKFWIVRGRRVVTRVLGDCRHCRRRYAKPCDQMMSDLPVERVTADKPPFSYVGIDYFGPFFVKKGRSSVKRYGCLFTCLASRAIHIEISHRLDTDSFIQALHRFISRRGQALVIRSDNGSNFIVAKKELRAAMSEWNHSKIAEFLKQRDIVWKFNPPYGSHMGGVWERIIRTIRKVLVALVPQQTLDDESLTTLMCQVESVINSRPITVVSSDPQDLGPLTPNHLLLMRSGSSLPPGIFNKSDMYSKRRWRQVQYLSDIFWKRWLVEYLPSLQERQRWFQPRRNISVGDVVLLVDQQTPRSLWPLARVTETFPGRDGLVRTVRVKTNSSMFIRPVDKICLLETA